MTPLQQETKKYVDSFIKKNNRMPTVREVCSNFNLSSSCSGWLRLQQYKKLQKECSVCGSKLKIC